MRNGELQAALQALTTLANVRLPVKTGLKIRAMMRSLNHLSEDIEAERKKLIGIYAQKDERGEPIVIDVGGGMGRYEFGDNLSDFDAEYNALMACEVAGRPAALRITDLGDVMIEPLVLLQLGDLLADVSTDNE